MSGYAPLFDSLTTGTLCGKWPDIGLWPIVLAMADKHGVLDVTPAYISGVTGLIVGEVTACMARFCEPDPYSRTPTEDGRRLVLLDPERRNWGWKIVNHTLYRERARKMAFDARRAESGENAARMKERRHGPDATRDGPTKPDATQCDPPSNANTNSEKIGQNPSGFDRFWSAYPKRVKRKTAEEIWKRKKLEIRTDELLADIAQRLAEDRRWRDGFIPDPTTYLNQERWDDEVQRSRNTNRGVVV